MPDGQPSMFPTTNWTDLAALRQGEPEAMTALQRLCSAYWFPIYAYIRRQNPDAERARDLTQGFFGQLLERDSLSRVAFHGGRFRSFLLTACRNYLADNHRHESRQIRRPEGGWVDMETAELEGRYSASLGSKESPELLFERQWALAVIDRAFKLVEADYQRRGREDLYRLLHRYLDADPAALPHREAAAQLGMSEAAVKAELHRLRQRLREALQSEVSATITEPSAAESELSLLLQALAGS